MQWQGRRESSNVEDRRGSGGGMGRMGGIGGGVGLLLLLIYFLMGGDPSAILGGQNQQNFNTSNVQMEQNAQQEDLYRFSSVVMADLEDVWHQVFKENGRTLQEAKMVVYTGQVQSGCGFASSAAGPFYCPADEKIYLDLSFYDELKNQFKAPGDYAFAYVIAHEYGHHIQTQLGITEQVMSLRSRMSEQEFNTNYLVRFELQADYFAGLFTKHIQGKGYLEEGDVQEAMRAASAVGDDSIQEKTLGYVVPDKFTHGTSEQRMHWFKKGYDEGTLQGGDTYNTRQL